MAWLRGTVRRETRSSRSQRNTLFKVARRAHDALLYWDLDFDDSGRLPRAEEIRCQNVHFNQTIANGQKRTGFGYA